jgi:hypothetical protein
MSEGHRNGLIAGATVTGEAITLHHVCDRQEKRKW